MLELGQFQVSDLTLESSSGGFYYEVRVLSTSLPLKLCADITLSNVRLLRVMYSKLSKRKSPFLCFVPTPIWQKCLFFVLLLADRVMDHTSFTH